jgi:hypothetical protein
MATMRYLLRAVGRPTPFGLFAGVAPVQVDAQATVEWGTGHRLLVRADTLWLDEVIERLEISPTLLAGLDVAVNDLAVDRGDRIEAPRGSGRVSVRNTAVVRLVRETATAPMSLSSLVDAIAGAFPEVPVSAIEDVLRLLISHGILITALRAPMTVTDPLGHVIDVLADAGPGRGDNGLPKAGDLNEIAALIQHHNTTDDLARQSQLRAQAGKRMRRLSTAGRTPLAGDLNLDCAATVPADLAAEMAGAVAALVRLTRRPRPALRALSGPDHCSLISDRVSTMPTRPRPIREPVII